MKNKSSLMLLEMLAGLKNKFATPEEVLLVLRCSSKVLDLDDIDCKLQIPMFLCDGSSYISNEFSEQSFVQLWKDGCVIFRSWDFFIGMNERGLITHIIVREGAEYFDRLKEVLTLLEPEEQVSVWEGGSDVCGSLQSLKCFNVPEEA